jgi:hypothetical protein
MSAFSNSASSISVQPSFFVTFHYGKLQKHVSSFMALIFDMIHHPTLKVHSVPYAAFVSYIFSSIVALLHLLFHQRSKDTPYPHTLLTKTSLSPRMLK